jgi:TolB-like protein
MSDVFISYARSTARQAQIVAEALSALGYAIWRDDQLPAHRAYSDVIEERLRAAKAVLVLWSADAAKSQWVRAEAELARSAGTLVQLSLDGVAPPLPFNQIHCADLSGWTGDAEAREWRTVLSSIADLTDQAAKPDSGQPPASNTDRSIAHIGSRSRPGEGPKLKLPAAPSIAVLPFKNISGDPEQEYFADAITEDIVIALSRWRWFFVIARHTSFRYKDRDVDVGRVGHELGVGYALEGSVRKVGDRARVTAQLIDTGSGSNVWADRFDCDLVDVLALQDEITEQAVAAIEPAMVLREGVRAAHKPLADFSALDCFYRGMWHLNKLSEGDDGEALTLFRDAIRRDPELSLGHIGLARVLYGRAIFGTSPEPIATLREARAAAQTGIALDPRDATGYFASAGASLYLGDHRSALESAQRAIRLNQNFAYGHYRLGQVLIFAGRASEAIEPIERSLRLSPYDPQLGLMLETLALANYQTENYEAAVNHATSSINMTEASGSVILAASLARLGRTQEAEEAFRRARWSKPSTKRPLAPPYAVPAQLEHLREGLRLAGGGGGR